METRGEHKYNSLHSSLKDYICESSQLHAPVVLTHREYVPGIHCGDRAVPAPDTVKMRATLPTFRHSHTRNGLLTIPPIGPPVPSGSPTAPLLVSSTSSDNVYKVLIVPCIWRQKVPPKRSQNGAIGQKKDQLIL